MMLFMLLVLIGWLIWWKYFRNNQLQLPTGNNYREIEELKQLRQMLKRSLVLQIKKENYSTAQELLDQLEVISRRIWSLEHGLRYSKILYLWKKLKNILRGFK